MRAGIRAALIEAIPAIDGQVLEVHETGTGLVKPYVVVRAGQEIETVPWLGFRQLFEIRPYVERTSFADLDVLAEEIIAVLHERGIPDSTGGSETFVCRYEGEEIGDTEDAARDGLTRSLRFAVAPVNRTPGPDATLAHGWLEALTSWTETAAGADWTVYRGILPHGYARPAVMWRHASLDAAPVNYAAGEVRQRISGHVLGRTPNEGAAMIAGLLEQLNQAVKIPLDLPDRRYLRLSELAADFGADPLTEGQISLTLSRRSIPPSDPSELMREVRFHY